MMGKGRGRCVVVQKLTLIRMFHDLFFSFVRQAGYKRFHLLFYFFVKILDHEQEVCSTTGKSHAVIPAFTFYRDRTGDEDEKQKRG